MISLCTYELNLPILPTITTADGNGFVDKAFGEWLEADDFTIVY